MKTLLSIAAFCCLTLPVRSQTAGTTTNPPTLRQALVAFTWTWQPARAKLPGEVRFYKDGTAMNPLGWIATWKVTGLRTVTLETNKKNEKAFLTFDPTFSTYDGIFWDGRSKVSGGRKAPADPDAIRPTPRK